jgi:hypothetical protein
VVVQGEIIIFRTNKISKADQVKLSRSLYGYVEKSFHNKYAYPRPGALQDIPYIRPLDWRAVLVTRTDDAPKVLQLLEEYGAQIYTRRIQLEEEDIHKLTRDTDTGTGTGTGTGDTDTGEKAQAQDHQ